MKNWFLILASVLIVATALSACAAATQVVGEFQDPIDTGLPVGITATPAVTAAISETQTTNPQELPEDGKQESVSTPTTRPLISTRTELSASDPASFQLKSDKVQLVEFFAFW